MIATKQTTRPAVLAGRLERDRLLSWLGLVLALAISAGLNLWNLAQNGYANLYYSVAVQSMMQSRHNFFFAAYDAGGFISVDKPPGHGNGALRAAGAEHGPGRRRVQHQNAGRLDREPRGAGRILR